MARADGFADIGIKSSLHIHLRRPNLFLSDASHVGGDFSLEQLFYLGTIPFGLFSSVLLGFE